MQIEKKIKNKYSIHYICKEGDDLILETNSIKEMLICVKSLEKTLTPERKKNIHILVYRYGDIHKICTITTFKLLYIGKD